MVIAVRREQFVIVSEDSVIAPCLNDAALTIGGKHGCSGEHDVTQAGKCRGGDPSVYILIRDDVSCIRIQVTRTRAEDGDGGPRQEREKTQSIGTYPT